MKMKSIFLIAFLACSTFFANANNIETGSPTAELQQQVSEMVLKSSIWESAKEDFKLIVTFTVNNDGEVVILSTNNRAWDESVKSLLNYRKIDVNDAVKNKIFHLPITLEKIG